MVILKGCQETICARCYDFGWYTLPGSADFLAVHSSVGNEQL